MNPAKARAGLAAARRIGRAAALTFKVRIYAMASAFAGRRGATSLGLPPTHLPPRPPPPPSPSPEEVARAQLRCAYCERLIARLRWWVIYREVGGVRRTGAEIWAVPVRRDEHGHFEEWLRLDGTTVWWPPPEPKYLRRRRWRLGRLERSRWNRRLRRWKRRSRGLAGRSPADGVRPDPEGGRWRRWWRRVATRRSEKAPPAGRDTRTGV